MTPDFLVRALGASRANAELAAGHLTAACLQYGINTPARQAAFLAQLAHESGALHYRREIASGSAYEGREDLGNDQAGDGVRYAGRGYIQTTGRDNYRRTTFWLRTALGPGVPDFEAHPELLEEPRWAAWSAAAYWHHNKLNALADAGEFVKIGRAINRGNPNSTKPANGEADRLKRWARVKQVLEETTAPDTVPAVAPAPEPQPEQPMPAPFIAAVAPAFLSAAAGAIAEAVPKLGDLFAGESPVAQRNVAAAKIVVEAAKEALGVPNEQAVVEQLQTNPEAASVVAKAVEANWFAITEAGGGGIAGAREADQKRIDASEKIRDVFKSHSFWMAIGLLPLVYLIVMSLIGLVGTATWSDDVRAGLSGSIVSAVIGGLVGYYFGQTTSRNRAP